MRSVIIISTIRYLIIVVGFFWLLIWFFDIRIKTQKEKLIGSASDPFTIDNIEVAEKDYFGSYSDVSKTAKELGEGWRIPTIEEYKLLNKNRDKLDLQNTIYWCSDSSSKNSHKKIQFFIPDGKTQSLLLKRKDKYERLWFNFFEHDENRHVRFVRTIPNSILQD